MRLLRRVDRRGLLRFLSAQDPATHERYPDLGRDRLEREMYVVTAAGKRLPGIEAVRYLSRRLPLLWPLALILHLPGTAGLWRWVYAKVAEHRYFFGRTGGCCAIRGDHADTP
jgi:predicted DCC family thiol-disulfide oxidoreductase YuxK